MANSDSSRHVLILPGWQSSGPMHWQSRWEVLHGDTRVEQHDWMRPLRGDWMAQLEEAVLAAPAPAVLVAHSLGCQLVAAWAAHSRNTHRVLGALLVAPGDPEREALRGVLRKSLPQPGGRILSTMVTEGISTPNRAWATGPRAGPCCDS